MLRSRVDDLHSSHEEHQRDADLLLPVKLQTAELPQRDSKNPEIQSYTHGCVRPGNGVCIRTETLMQPIPLLPEERNRPTLEYGDENKSDAPNARYDESYPEKALDISGGEDAHVEADNR